MKRFFILLFIPLLFLSACNKPTETKLPELTVVFSDVGKADFILICCNGKFAVIDAGYKSSADKIDEIMDSYGVTALEFAVATHNDKDHIGGMAHVIEKYDPEILYINYLPADSKQYENMTDAANVKGTVVKKLKRNDTFSLSGASFKVLSPDDGLLELDDENESSIVLKMTYGNKSVLFTGDAQFEAENNMLLNCKKDLSCSVIKIAHHGSEKASSKEFLLKTGAEYAVISTGDEEPASAQTLKTLSDLNITVFNTDTDGDIILKTDGVTVSVSKKGS